MDPEQPAGWTSERGNYGMLNPLSVANGKLPFIRKMINLEIRGF